MKISLRTVKIALDSESIDLDSSLGFFKKSLIRSWHLGFSSVEEC